METAQSVSTKEPRSAATLPRKGNLRWWLAGVFFIIGLIAYMDRANLSVVAEPMMRELNMSKVEFGLLGSLFSLGYALTQVPGGMLAERFGNRIVMTFSLVAWSLFTVLTALTPKYLWLCLVRFLFGVGEAPTYPCNAVFNAWWFQKHEKARAASALLSGSYFGPVIAPTLTVAIMLAWGWQAVFYIFGAIGIVIALIWYLVARSRPEEHPWLGEEERDLITRNRSINTARHGVKAPWRQFIRNPQFWALAIQYFCVAYMTGMFMIWLPTYLQEAQGFSLKRMGIAAGFPWLAICLFVLTGGTLSDTLLKRGKSVMLARGYTAITGLVIFIIAIYFAAYTATPWMSVFWLSLALGSLGLPVVMSWAVAADKGQQFAGSVSGWMNLWGNLGGVVSPVICGWIAQTLGWNIALLVNIVPILIAIIAWYFVRPGQPLSEPEAHQKPITS